MDASSTRAAGAPPVAEAGWGISGASHPGFQQRPAAPWGWDRCSSHALAARARFEDRGARHPFPSSPGSQPSKFTHSLAFAFCSVFRPEVTEDLPQGGERRRRLSLILIGVEV